MDHGRAVGARIRLGRFDGCRRVVGLRRELPARFRYRYSSRAYAGRRELRSRDFVTGAVVGTGVVNLPAVIGIAAVTGLLILGVSESAFVNNIVVAIKVTVVVAFIAIGAFYVDPALWSPLVPAAVPPPAVEQRPLERDRHGALGRRDGAEHGPVRRRRNHHGGRDDLLRLHRLRSRFDGRCGIEESEPRHADRNSGLADHLHDPLHPHVCRARRDRPVHGSQRRCADRESREPDRPSVVRRAREDRRDRGPVVGHARAALRSDADLLHDGARRPDPARVRDRSTRSSRRRGSTR